jgi:hypothetical protein
MRRNLEPRGICIVRVTRDSTGLILTVVSRPDVSEAGGAHEETHAGVDQGLAVVRRFLDEFDRRTRTD